MRYDPAIHHRRSIRLKGYDYSAQGAYFVTVCVQGGECLFGKVVEGAMNLNSAGRMVEEVWNQLTLRYPGVLVDSHVVMPNHFHGIVMINDLVGAGSSRPQLENTKDIQGITRAMERHNHCGMTPNNEGGMTPPLRRQPTLGQIVGYFKYRSTKEINEMRGMPPIPVWQRGYYERIIRCEKELDTARKYILENPMKWVMDKENPENIPD